MSTRITKAQKTTLAWVTTLCGLLALLHGSLSLVLLPASKIGALGIPEAAWAGSAITSGLVCLVVSHLVHWRR